MQEAVATKGYYHCNEGNDDHTCCAIYTAVGYCGEGRAAENTVDDAKSCDCAEIEGNNDRNEIIAEQYDG